MSWCDVLTGAGAAITARANATYFSTGFGAAITAGAGTMYFSTGARCCDYGRGWYGVAHHWRHHGTEAYLSFRSRPAAPAYVRCQTTAVPVVRRMACISLREYHASDAARVAKAVSWKEFYILGAHSTICSASSHTARTIVRSWRPLPLRHTPFQHSARAGAKGAGQKKTQPGQNKHKRVLLLVLLPKPET